MADQEFSPTPNSSTDNSLNSSTDNSLYTRYIKISKIDKNGIDNSQNLSTLNTISIPWSNGTIAVYNVIGISQDANYFNYVVEYNPTSNINYQDAANLDYNYDSVLGLFGFGRFTNINPIQPTQILPTGSYILPKDVDINIGGDITKSTIFFDTYIQKEIEIEFSGSVQLSTIEDDPVYLECCLFDPNGGKIIPSTTSTSNYDGLKKEITSTGANYDTFNTKWTLQPNEIPPGSALCLFIRRTSTTSLTPINSVQFTRPSFLNISSSIATDIGGNSIVLEPILDYKFTNSNCDVIQNNVIESRPNPYIQDIDYSTSQTTPINLTALKNYTATKATYPLSVRSSTTSLNPTYGSRNYGGNSQPQTTVVDNYDIGYNKNNTNSEQISCGTYLIYYSSLTKETTPILNTTLNYHDVKFNIEYIITSNDEIEEAVISQDIEMLLKYNLLSSPSNGIDNNNNQASNMTKKHVELFRYAPFSSSSSTTVEDTFKFKSANFKVINNGTNYILSIENELAEGSSLDGLPTNGGGLLYPKGIEFTSKGTEFITKAKELLLKKGII